MLPKYFFKKHPLDQYSAAMFADLSIRMITWEKMNEEIEKIIGPNIEAKRRMEVLEQKKQIDALQTSEEIVARMRKDNDTLSQPLLCKKQLLCRIKSCR